VRGNPNPKPWGPKKKEGNGEPPLSLKKEGPNLPRLTESPKDQERDPFFNLLAKRPL